ILLCWIERSILGNSYQLSGAQLDPLLNARRIEVARSAPMQAAPRIAAARDVALVTWVEDPENSGATTIFARRVSASGRLIDAAPIRLAESAASYSEPLVAASDREFVVTWSDNRLGWLLRRVSRDGTLPEPRPLELKIQAFAIASDGDRFAFLRFENGAPALSFLDRFGQMQHATPAAIDPGGGLYGGAALAWDGSRYLGVWARFVTIDDIQRQKVAAIWFDRDGRALTGALPLGGTSKVEDEAYPTAACASGSCVVAWSVYPELRAVEIDAFGAVRMIPNRCCNLVQTHVTASAINFLMTWNVAVDGLMEFQAVSIHATGDQVSATQILLRDTLSASAALMPDGTLLLTYATTVKGPAHGDVPRVFVRSSSSADRRRAVQH
ncbi:MAG: hypothetical protein ACXW3E_03665, partial [Thermoanaerobaculia bacterium]